MGSMNSWEELKIMNSIIEFDRQVIRFVIHRKLYHTSMPGTLPGMLKQKYGNGYWVALTLKACPGCPAIYHFVPFAFIGGIIVTSVLAACHHSLLAKMMWGSVQLSGGYYVINGCQGKEEVLAGIAASVFILFIAC